MKGTMREGESEGGLGRVKGEKNWEEERRRLVRLALPTDT